MTTLHTQDVAPPSQSYLFDNPKPPSLKRPSWRPYHNVVFSQSERRQILKIHMERRITASEAARLLNRPYDSVRRLFNELDIRLTNRRPVAVGTIFGMLTVIDNSKIVRKGNRSLSACLVRCGGCGIEKIIVNSVLRRGASKSCGSCGRKRPEAGWKVIWSLLKKNADCRKIDVRITPEQVRIIGQLPCAYCSHPPQNRYYRTSWRERHVRVKDKQPSFLFSGIDRVDSTKGYFPGNVVPCCRFCNHAKKNHSLDFFIEQLARYGSTLTSAAVLRLCAEVEQALILKPRD